MSMPASTANWHWKNKDVTSWARAWFERELTTISIDGEGSESVSVTSVRDVEGDVELGQRKSKLITIYDCKVQLQWSGTASDGTSVEGKLTIPEVSHEITLDRLSDYTYEWSLKTESSPAVDSLYAFAKARIPPALEAKFAEFPVAMIDTHGKDLTVSAEPSRTGTPVSTQAVPAPVTSTGATTSAVSKPALAKKVAVNTSEIVKEAVFMAAADDLYSLLTDESRIPAWTRSGAQSVPQPGSSYSLFGGSVRGKYVSLVPGKEITQTWSLQSPVWPPEHEAKLTITLDQSSDSTTVTFTLEGVPKGLEDEVGRNLEGYYIHGLKSIGLGAVL
ncbi:activator of Hsp90 ATPase [Pisolithus croceorrhizus]|nr:activator of Hsp90 ATPase [Pisolithus croceorrhizus]KAI6132038.1 activator of Hsp90 ATPase [Pisolithus croceorrhizus]